MEPLIPRRASFFLCVDRVASFLTRRTLFTKRQMSIHVINDTSELNWALMLVLYEDTSLMFFFLSLISPSNNLACHDLYMWVCSMLFLYNLTRKNFGTKQYENNNSRYLQAALCIWFFSWNSLWSSENSQV